MANSRMKDIHDIWMLAHNLDFDGQRLSEAIQKTFERRTTNLPAPTPTAFKSEFFEDSKKLIQWRAFLSKGLVLAEDISLADVVKVLRDFLLPPTEALIAKTEFISRWSPGSWTK